jgi:predicted signal transduction protein with EAL and GGDEF domain
MRKIILTVIATIFFGVGFHFTANACTNYLITKGASADGSTMISYSADSHEPSYFFIAINMMKHGQHLIQYRCCRYGTH